MMKQDHFARSEYALRDLREDLAEREFWDVAAAVEELLYGLDVAEAQYKDERKTRSP
jgi:hypothetical protein